jgi:hypothetical protein
VRIALVERFGEPSRRCDPTLVTGPDDEVTVWDLAPDDAPPSLLSVAWRAPRAWLTTGLSPSRVAQYLRACIAMIDHRRTALLRIPAMIRAARRRDVDALACFSADGFELARLLAEDAGLPLQEQLARSTQYFGEFAFELLAVVPYAYWLHQHGRLEFTVSTADTRALYYFSPHHIERTTPRRYVPITEYPVGEQGVDRYDAWSFPATLDTSQWSPPPYREVFADDRFRFPKPLVVIGNKTSDEPYLGRDAGVNSIPVDTLVTLVERLTSRYTVVYNRPREADIVGDHDPLREPGDLEAIASMHPHAMTIQQVHAEHPDLTFNELQLRLYAGCERFVSVLGGGSYLASWFGGTNIVLAQAGWEVDCGAYERWFDRFSGAEVLVAGSAAELVRLVDERFLAHD